MRPRPLAKIIVAASSDDPSLHHTSLFGYPATLLRPSSPSTASFPFIFQLVRYSMLRMHDTQRVMNEETFFIFPVVSMFAC